MSNLLKTTPRKLYNSHKYLTILSEMFCINFVNYKKNNELTYKQMIHLFNLGISFNFQGHANVLRKKIKCIKKKKHFFIL